MKLRFALLLALGLLACSREKEAAPPAVTARPALSAALGFRCLWWSEAQMEGLDPNAPPAKATEVAIDHWEYTDPVGVPHPDTIDLVAELQNEGPGAASALTATLTLSWKVGPLDDPGAAAWGAPTTLESLTGIALAPGESRSLRVPITLAPEMEQLHAEGRWPHELRVSLVVRGPAGGEHLLQSERNFPIRPGD
jgi:hypothetical protein